MVVDCGLSQVSRQGANVFESQRGQGSTSHPFPKTAWHHSHVSPTLPRQDADATFSNFTVIPTVPVKGSTATFLGAATLLSSSPVSLRE